MLSSLRPYEIAQIRVFQTQSTPSNAQDNQAKPLLSLRTQASRLSNASTCFSREMNHSNSFKTPRENNTQDVTPIYIENHEDTSHTFQTMPKRSYSLGNGIKQVTLPKNLKPLNLAKVKLNPTAKNEPYFPTVSTIPHNEQLAAWSSTKLLDFEQSKRQNARIRDAIKQKLESARVIEEEKLKEGMVGIVKVRELMSRCDSLFKEVSRVDRKINKTNSTYKKSTRKLKKRCDSTGRFKDFWKNNPEFLEQRAKMNFEVNEFRMNVKQKNARILPTTEGDENLSDCEDIINKTILKEPHIAVPRVKPLNKFDHIERRAQSISSKEELETEQRSSPRNKETERGKNNGQSSPRKRRAVLKREGEKKPLDRNIFPLNSERSHVSKEKLGEVLLKRKGSLEMSQEELGDQKIKERSKSTLANHMAQYKIKLGYSDSSKKSNFFAHKKIII